MKFSLSTKLLTPFKTQNRVMNAGLTLIEIIIVVALLGTLMTYLVSNLVGVQDSAKEDQARLGMGVIAQSLQMYRVHNGSFPTTAQGLKALVENPGSSRRWRGPYIEEEKLMDPFGKNSATKLKEEITRSFLVLMRQLKQKTIFSIQKKKLSRINIHML